MLIEVVFVLVLWDLGIIFLRFVWILLVLLSCSDYEDCMTGESKLTPLLCFVQFEIFYRSLQKRLRIRLIYQLLSDISVCTGFILKEIIEGNI